MLAEAAASRFVESLYRMARTSVITVPATAQHQQGARDRVALEVGDRAGRPGARARGEGGADGLPEVGEQGVGVGAARAGVAQDDDDQDGEADADDARQALAGEGGRADGEDHQGAEPPQAEHAAGQRAEPDGGPAAVRGAGARADGEHRRAQVAAHAPADEQVEQGQATAVVGGRGHDFLGAQNPLLARTPGAPARGRPAPGAPRGAGRAVADWAARAAGGRRGPLGRRVLRGPGRGAHGAG